MTRADLLALADRVEAEPASFALWIRAVDALHKHDISASRGRFVVLMEAGAFIDAADMLRPVGHNLEIGVNMTGGRLSAEANVFFTGRPARASCWGFVEGDDAIARAYLAANLRAHAAEAGDG